MVLADVDPAHVALDVVDAVGDRLALLADEVVDVHRHRFAPGPPLPAPVLELADQLLLLAVHRDHRQASIAELAGLLVEVVELGVAVGMLSALHGLDVGLEAVALFLQHDADRASADRVTAAGEGQRERAGALAGPAQWRFGIAATSGSM